eukprot:s5491_g3.t1
MGRPAHVSPSPLAALALAASLSEPRLHICSSLPKHLDQHGAHRVAMWPFTGCTALGTKSSRVKAERNLSCETTLSEIWKLLDRRPAQCVSCDTVWTGEHFSDFSVLEDGLKKVVSGEKDCWRLLADAAADNQGCGAAMASMLGLAIGDAVGAPLEFLPVNQLLPDHLGGYSDARRPCVLPPGLKEYGDKLQYRNPYNKFQLLPGQWTDDTSMALCLADSLLVSQGYNGADVRVRWHMWWFQGYCNAFRHDGHRRYRTSVGLGGNVSKSLAEVERLAARDGLHSVPPIYGSVTNDAGNGSIMRLAPVPIAYYLNPVEAMEKAILQSRATHPSCDAAACCAFMAFFIAKAIRLHSQGLSPASQDFIASVIPEFLASGFQDLAAFRNMAGCGRTDGVRRIRALLTCTPPSPKEASWDWKSTELQIWEAMKERWKDRRYNGHPIIDTYWGAYCMDGLAMALWALWHTDCWYGLSVSLGWGCLGALVSVYGLMKGVKLRHPNLKLGSGIDVSLTKYLFFVIVAGKSVSLVVSRVLKQHVRSVPGKGPVPAAQWLVTAKQQAALLQSMVKSSPDVNPGKGPKWQRQSRRKGGHYTSGSGWGNQKQDWWSTKDLDKDKNTAELTKLCCSMAKLILRHENQQSIDRSQKGFVLFCQARGLLSVVPDLKKTAEV